MPVVGSIIANAMAFVWASISLLAAGLPIWMLLAPATVSGALIAASARLRPTVANLDQRRRIGRLVGIASAGEGLGILLGINLVSWAGRPDLWICVFVAVVGIHFFPLARWMPAPPFYIVGAAFVVIAALGLGFPTNLRTVIEAGAASFVLWGANGVSTSFGAGSIC